MTPPGLFSETGYTVLAYLFRNPAELDLGELAAACRELSDQARMLDRAELGASFQQLEEALEGLDPAAAALAYTRLSIGEERVLLDEAENDINIFNRMTVMADVQGFYRAFGFQIAESANERSDYVGVELEFMRVLTVKLATAEEAGLDEAAETCRIARRNFLGNHLGRFIPEIAAQLRDRGRGTYFEPIANALEQFIEFEMETHAVRDAGDS